MSDPDKRGYRKRMYSIWRTEGSFEATEQRIVDQVKNIQKKGEKIEHYSDLKRELKKIWKCSHIEIVPIIVGALGIVSKNLEGWMKKISLKSSTAQLQKATLLGTARILRKTLET